MNKSRTRWYVEATVVYWDDLIADFVEIDLEHYSPEETAEAAEDDAREVWADHGHSPESVTVRPLKLPEDWQRCDCCGRFARSHYFPAICSPERLCVDCA